MATLVTVDRFNNRIHCKFPYSVTDVNRVKRIPGRSWSKQAGAWTMPLSIETCLALRETFGDRLRISEDLATWARAAFAEEKALTTLSAAKDATLLQLQGAAPILAEALRHYQRVAAVFGAESRQFLLADQPGLGKTLETLASIGEAGMLAGSHLIIAPKTALRTVWEREISRWLGEDRVKVVVATGSPKRKQELVQEFFTRQWDDPESRWLIINPEALRGKDVEICPPCEKCKWKGKTELGDFPLPEILSFNWNSVVIDEGHRVVRNPKTLVARTMHALRTYESGFRIVLTGTPMNNRPKDLWGSLHWCRPLEYKSFWQWADAYLEIEDNGYGKTIGAIRNDKQAAFDRTISRVMLRRTKAEVLPELPPKQYVDVWCEMGPEQARAYQQMVDHAQATINGLSITATGVLAEMTRLKQFATSAGTIDDERHFHPALPSCKFDQLVELLAERGISGKKEDAEGTSKALVCSQSSEVVHMVANALRSQGIECHVMTGATTMRERARMQDEFQAEGGPRVFLFTTTAGGVAITLDAADDVFFMDETWIPSDQEQAEDRAHRASNTEHQVTIYYLRTVGTIDESIMANVDAKEDVQKYILDGRRGVDYAKTLIERPKGKVK